MFIFTDHPPPPPIQKCMVCTLGKMLTFMDDPCANVETAEIQVNINILSL